MAETVTVCLRADEIYDLQSLASVDSVTWWCRLCGGEGHAETQPLTRSGAIEHLAVDHQATITGD